MPKCVGSRLPRIRFESWLHKISLVLSVFVVVLAWDQRCTSAQEIPSNEWQRFEARFPAMGVPFKVVAYATDKDCFERGLRLAKIRIAEIEKSLSDYDGESEVSRLAQSSPHTQPQPLSTDLAHVCRVSALWFQKTDGAFDPTIGPVTARWRIARKRGRPVAEDVRLSTMTKVGWNKLAFDGKNGLQMSVAGMKLDFGGIAKGYAADEALSVFAKHKMKAVLIDASGDIRVSDPPPGRSTWRIQIGRAGSEEVLYLKHAGVATSGDTTQRLTFKGKTYSHIIDPRSGTAIENSCIVTIVADDATTADVLASAVSVLGRAKGLQLVEGLERVEARLECPEQGTPNTQISSSGFDFFQHNPQDAIRKSSYAPGRSLR